MAILVRAVLLATPVVFFPYLIGSFEAPKAMVVRIAGLALLVAALPGRGARHGLSWNLLDRAVGTWLLIETAATLFARAPMLSLFGEQHQREGLLTSLALAGLYLGARLSIRDRGRLDAIGDAWLVGAAIAGAYALLQAAGLDPAPWSDTAILSGTMRPFGTLGHPNLLGAVTAPAAALSLARALETPVRRRLHLAAAGLLAAATLVTLSRAAWLGLAAGAGVAWALQARARRVRPSGRALWIGAAALASLVVVAVVSGWGALFVARLRDMITGAGSGAARLEIWRIALAAFRERPLLGQGPDMLGLVFTRLQTPAMWNLEWGRVADHAHSIYLHTLATRGLLGFLVGGACTAALVAGLRAAWRGSEATRAPVAALAAALTALAVTGAFGALGITGAAVTVVLVASVAALGSSSFSAASTGAGRPRPRPGAGGGGRSAAGAAGGARAPRTRHILPATVAALAMLLWSLNEMSVSYEVRQTLRWLERHRDVSDRETQLAAAVLADRCELAAKRVPYDDWAPRTLSETLARWASGWPEPLPLLEQAAAAARAAVARVPLRSLDHLRLAEALAARVVHGDRGAEAECEAAFQRAATLAPQDAHVLVEWTRARLAFGRSAAALPLARRVADLYPGSGIAHGALAESHLALGDEAAARRALARALAGTWHGDDGGRRRAEELGRRLGMRP